MHFIPLRCLCEQNMYIFQTLRFGCGIGELYFKQFIDILRCNYHLKFPRGKRDDRGGFWWAIEMDAVV